MKAGLFFGSYDPVHIGHLAIANYMVEYGGIDQLWFVVSPHNPFKKQENLLDDSQRLEMVRLAIAGDQRFVACDIEFKLPKPSYTINTLEYLSEEYPKYQFIPIMGSDNYVNISQWKDYQILANNYHFLVYPRPGFAIDASTLPFNFRLVEAPLIEISSTFIRKAIAEKHDVRHFLPPSVHKYIEEMAFYK
jgi:nicotinate-nucleotide adenylyltransferase